MSNNKKEQVKTWNTNITEEQRRHVMDIVHSPGLGTVLEVGILVTAGSLLIDDARGRGPFNIAEHIPPNLYEIDTRTMEYAAGGMLLVLGVLLALWAGYKYGDASLKYDAVKKQLEDGGETNIKDELRIYKEFATTPWCCC